MPQLSSIESLLFSACNNFVVLLSTKSNVQAPEERTSKVLWGHIYWPALPQRPQLHVHPCLGLPAVCEEVWCEPDAGVNTGIICKSDLQWERVPFPLT